MNWSSIAATIGGMCRGDYCGWSATELDPQANMAVAGANMLIISKSGLVATVIPFLPDIPLMDNVKIGHVAMVYDDPRSGITYLLVMCNALLIPKMNHNLLPPFLIRMAGLFLDKTPKCHAPDPTVTHHSIVVSATGVHIHLDLNGIFSYFLTRQLNVEKMENWESYPVVYLAPDLDQWDPNTTNFSKQEDAMLDADGYIIDQEQQNSMIIAAADLIALYVEPPLWDQFQPVIGAVLVGDEDQESYPTGELEWSSIDDVYHNPSLFSC